jgi:cell division septation protein DedD
MRPDDDAGPEAARELRLEGGLLAVAGGVLLALLFGAFQLGRVVERWSAPARSASSSADPMGNVEREVPDATEKLTFFDTLSGGGKEAEPSRQTQTAKPATTSAPPPPVAPGTWFVQVFVGRDRQAAEDVVRSLREKQYPVRIDAVAEGASGSLFKVRVGGFPTKEAADQGAERLHADGHAGTWVVRVTG